MCVCFTVDPIMCLKPQAEEEVSVCEPSCVSGQVDHSYAHVCVYACMCLSVCMHVCERVRLRAASVPSLPPPPPPLARPPAPGLESTRITRVTMEIHQHRYAPGPTKDTQDSPAQIDLTSSGLKSH